VAVEVRFAPEAAADVAAGFRWYDDQRSGLGSQFLDCVLACLERVRRTPDLYGRVHGEYRRALVRRFPYAVFYEIADGAVTVYCIVHTAREPSKWQSRLP
jgi:plasmid stabilization system protein ParE